MLGIPKLFRGLKNQSFSYKPRYFDPLLEDLHERLKNRDGEDDDEKRKGRIRSGFRQSFRGDSFGNVRKQEVKMANFRLLLVTFVLLFITYIILTKYLPRIIELIE